MYCICNCGVNAIFLPSEPQGPMPGKGMHRDPKEELWPQIRCVVGVRADTSTRICTEMHTSMVRGPAIGTTQGWCLSGGGGGGCVCTPQPWHRRVPQDAQPRVGRLERPPSSAGRRFSVCRFPVFGGGPLPFPLPASPSHRGTNCAPELRG